MKKTMKNLLCAALVILICVTYFPLSYVSAETAQIPEDAVEFNGHYYKVYEIDKTWEEAKSFCEDLDGHLVTVTSEQENSFVMSIIGSYYCFMGATDKDSEGIWTWVTGETWNYTNWMDGEPNNGENINECQNHLAMYGENGEEGTFGKWDDGWGEYHYFICEWENQYIIAGKTFNKNIDDFTTFTDSSVYNPELANMTAALSKAVYDKTEIVDAYKSLGFDYEFGDYDGEFNPYKSGHIIGFKESDYNDDVVCLVSVRGSIGSKINGSDWLGNYSISTTDDDKHIGFAYPANYIYLHIKEFINKKNITGNIKFVITGHSRGAAVANLLSVQLMELGTSPSNIYNYNFACPDVACKMFFDNYSNIFNLCNREDLVPFIPGNLASRFTAPGTSWGKFGKTYWFTKDADGTISPFADHDMELYLSFFNQQLELNEWDYTLGDLIKDDVYHTLDGWVAKILCPVDVIITDTQGNKIASVINGEINYYNSEFGEVIILTDGDKKVIYIKGDRDFNVDLIGTDTGTMIYSVEKYNYITEEVFEVKTFNDVNLEEGKLFYSPVSDAETTEEIQLFVIENSNGEDINTFEVETNGKETEINHIYETEVVKPTCTESGYSLHTCLNCANTYKDFYVVPTGHTDSEWIVDSDSTCTKEGSKHIECTICGDTVKTETTAKLPHDYNSVVTEATCEKGGYTTFTCVCGDTYTGDKTPAKGHSYAEGVCTACGESKVDNCSCNCHKGGFMGFIWKIINFFNKLFKTNKTCSCGVSHY